MRQAGLFATTLVVAAALAVAGCGGGGGGGTGNGFGGFGPAAIALDNPGGAADSLLGQAVVLCDWDGDALLDAFVGAPGTSSGAGAVLDAGAVRLYLQAPAGTWTLSRTLTTTDWAVAPADGALFGTALCVGDFDGDGRQDLAIGAPGDAVGAVSGAGRVYVLFNNPDHSGLPVGPLADPAGALASASFGEAMASGRVDGDLLDDLAVGSPDATVASVSLAGRVSVLTGAAPGSFGIGSIGPVTESAPETGARFGASIACGDVTDDGYADLVIGAPGAGTTTGGEAQIWSKGAGPAFVGLSTLETAEAGVSAEFGAAVALADVDGDGDLDVLVGIPFLDQDTTFETGAVQVFRNSTPASAAFVAGQVLVDRTPEFGAAFGAALSVGDVDGDGRADLVVGAPSATQSGAVGAGHVTYFGGRGNGSFVAPDVGDVYASTSPTDDAALGAALTIGDADGDGVMDLLVGAPGPWDPLSRLPGAAEVVTGQ